MRIFVAGATGVIGRRAVERLVAAGHQVTGVARTDEKAALLRDLGATPARVDLFDPAAVKDAVQSHDAVINLTTHIPRAAAAVIPGVWRENDRIRNEVSRNLVDAAIATGATRFVQESITFPYPSSGDAWIDEDVPPEGTIYASVLEAEGNAKRFSDGGVVLRFGMFYDLESHTTRDLVRLARLGRFGLPGAPDAYASFIATDDAAAAVVAALDAPTGVYNVVDDEPMRRSELAAALGDALGRRVKPLPAVSTKTTEPLARSQRVSNARFKEATGWRPATPNARIGLTAAVSELEVTTDRAPMAARVLLVLLLPATIAVGVWGTFFPRSFFDDFPGLSLVWVSHDGPFNEHLVRDFGATNLALAVLLAVAIWKGSRLLVGTAAAAYGVYALPHFVYHLRNTDAMGAGMDKSSSLSSLGAAVVLAVVAVVVVWRASTTRDMTR